MGFVVAAIVAAAVLAGPMVDGHTARFTNANWDETACPDEPDPGAGATAGGPYWGADLPETVRRWEPLLADHFCHHYAVEEALRIVACESIGDPAVVNPASGVTGLFQIHPTWFDHPEMGNPYDPDDNVAFAHWLWLETGGWAHWHCRPVP